MPGLNGGRIEALRMSSDGVRIALRVSRDGHTTLHIGRVERHGSGDAEQVSVEDLRQAAPQLAEVTAVSWSGRSRLVVVGKEEGGVQQVRYVQADGSTSSSGVLPGVNQVTAVRRCRRRPASADGGHRERRDSEAVARRQLADGSQGGLLAGLPGLTSPVVRAGARLSTGGFPQGWRGPDGPVTVRPCAAGGRRSSDWCCPWPVPAAAGRGPSCARSVPPGLAAGPRRVRPAPEPAGLPVVHAAAPYENAVRAMLLAHKERGALGLAGVLGGALAAAVRAGAGYPGERGPLLLVPVPSTRRATAGRGHDPVRRIAAAAAAELRRGGTSARVLAVLGQRRAVADQAGLGARERQANLAGALVVADGGRRLLGARPGRAGGRPADDGGVAGGGGPRGP